MYDIDGAADMVNDRVRMQAYEAALAAVVKPGDVVVDIGTGTGVLAMMALRCGARRVYAIEPDAVIQLAREIVAANGRSQDVEFLQAASKEVTLPEPADVLVSDLRGVLPVFHDHLATVIDARRRFLKPGGTQIPRADRLCLAVAESRQQNEFTAKPWQENPYGLDLRAGQVAAANRWVRVDLRPEQVLVEPVTGPTLDYTRVESLDFSWDARMQVMRAESGHGLCAWFETDLADGIGYTTAPKAGASVYGQAFFRWPRAVSLAPGDTVHAQVEARHVDGQYVWAWRTEIAGRGGERRELFAQSTFFGMTLSTESLRRGAATRVPVLASRGEVDRCILDCVDGRRTSGEIARQVHGRFPGRFASLEEALRRVTSVLAQYE